MKNAGVIAMAVAILLFVVGKFVETGPEKVTRLTGEFAESVEKRNWSRFEELLDPNVTFDIYGNRALLVAGAKMSVVNNEVKNISTSGFDVKAEPGGYIVTFMATADIEKAAYRTPTNWKFFWAKAATPDGYQIYRIDPLGGPGVPEEAVSQRLARPTR
ncbi:MAG: hypothetical protein QM754_17160 [Tepidisphaeraceae bacterium]